MKISDLPVLNDAKGNAYIPVVDPDETDPALRNKRIYLSTIAASVENFTPYDPAQEYTRTKPDFVSYSGNVYEYIAVTPSTGNLPTNTSYWKIVSAGQFNHVRNTDTGTNADSFFIGNPQGQDQEGSRILIFQENAAGPKMAIRYYFDNSTTPAARELQICREYTGTGSDVWVSFATIDDAVSSLTSTYSSEALDTVFEAFDLQDAYLEDLINTQAESIDELDVRVDVLEIDYKTGTVIDFMARTTYFGSLAIPETGNYTADLTGAVIGHCAVGFHNSGVEPTFSTPGVTFNKVGDKTYPLGQTSRILFHFVGSSTVDYMIL